MQFVLVNKTSIVDRQTDTLEDQERGEVHKPHSTMATSATERTRITSMQDGRRKLAKQTQHRRATGTGESGTDCCSS